jgi:type IV secretory pathway VirB2 component (pilin)
MKKTMKIILIVAFLFLVARGAQAAVEVKFGNPLSYTSISDVLSNIISYLKGIAGTIAVLFIIIGGVMYMLSGGNKEMMERGKKTVLYALIGTVIVVGASTIYNEITTILGGTTTTTATSLTTIASNALNFLLSIAGTLAIIMIVIGAIWMFTAGGDKERYELGKKTVIYAILGTVITVGALSIVSQIKTLMGG